MGTLKYAILGLLNRQEMTGYELTKAIEHSLLGSWRAKHSQIYPELKSLTQKGLVKYEVETIKGLGNIFFGGEGLFLTKLTGPGRVILQTQNIADFAGRIAQFIPTKSN